MDTILYSTDCPKCKVIELKLKKLNIEFTTITDIDKVIAEGKNHNIIGAPILQVGDLFFDFTNAVKYINERK